MAEPRQPMPPQPTQVAVGSQPPFNTYAIIAIIIAVFVLPPLGVYFGYVARQQIKETGERGIELAQAAIVAGWVLTATMAVGLFIFCAVFFVGLGVVGSIFGVVIART